MRYDECMNGKYIFFAVLALLAGVGALAFALASGRLILIDPQGPIAGKEAALIGLSIRLMLLVVLPVFVMTGVIAWRYRMGNRAARYLPNWEHNTMEELVWWLIPFAIIATLAVITWRSTEALDPYKPLAVPGEAPLAVDVVALDWKWLFIYPAQGIATVNYLELPAGVPIRFSLTADAPMNSFFIPALAGQMMAMPGMVTRLNLIAGTPGTFLGMSANYSGDGFAGMQFPVHVVSPADFSAWAHSNASSSAPLGRAQYAALALPSQNVPQASYALADTGLYTWIVMKYLSPSSGGRADAAGEAGEAPRAMPGM